MAALSTFHRCSDLLLMAALAVNRCKTNTSQPVSSEKALKNLQVARWRLTRTPATRSLRARPLLKMAE